MDAADGAGEKRGDGKDAELFAAGYVVFLGNGIGNVDLGEAGRVEAVHGGGPGEDAVGGTGDDVGGAVLLEKLCGLAQGPGGIDDVVNDDALLALNGTHDLHGVHHVGLSTSLKDGGHVLGV